MKPYLLPVFLFLFLFGTVLPKGNAQSTLTMNKPYSGAYSRGSTLGIYIFDDGQFALVAYATFLTGKYTLNGNAIHLKVDVPKDDFVILGRKEPLLKGKTKLTFNTAFAGTPVFIRFDDEPLKLVFDKTTNYVRSEYTTEINQRPVKLALTVANPEKPNAPNTTVFNPPADFNDLLLLYNKPSSDPESFDGTFEKIEGEMALKMNGDVLERNMDDTEMFQIVRRALAGREGKSDDSSLYFNDQLKSANGHDELSEDSSTFRETIMF